MKVILAGGSGLIGTKLTQTLQARGDEVIKLPRFGKGPWGLDGADAVINLAGANVGGARWSAEYKKEILQSRTQTTRALVDLMLAATSKPKVFINASAIGIYGDRGDEELPESAQRGAGYLADVCVAWEAETQRSPVRTVLLRTGVVLGDKDSALQKMLPPFKAFVGGPVGSGKQWFAWIHLDDEVSAILYALDHENVSGPINLAAPGIVTNSDFSKALGRALHRPSWAPVPGAALKLLLGEFAEVLLSGQRVLPRALQAAGFQFKYPTVDAALANLLAKR